MKLYSNVSIKLKLTDTDAAKVTNLEGEILAWRAILRDSNLLKDFNFSDKPKNIYSEELNANMANLTSNGKDKRLEFWDAVKNGKNIVNVKYNLLQIYFNLQVYCIFMMWKINNLWIIQFEMKNNL